MAGNSSAMFRGLASLAFLSCIVPLAQAAGWLDDFNDKSISDGNPVTWQTNPLGFFPGVYDASSGDYALSAPGSGNANQLLTWVDTFSTANAYVRAQGVILPGSSPDETSGNLALLARLDPLSFAGYLLYLDEGGQLGLQAALGSPQLVNLAPPVELGDINAASEVIMELNIIDNVLTGYAWRPGQPKPANPQITATHDAFPSGKVGIAYDEDDDNTTGVFRYVAAQDTPFVDLLEGDFNDDKRVDAADYVAWRDGLSSGATTPAGYELWRKNFGVTQAAASGAVAAGGATVPEPASWFVSLLAIVGGTPLFRRRCAA